MHFANIVSLLALAMTILALPTDLNSPSLTSRGVHDHQKCVTRGRPWSICNWWQDDSGPSSWAPCKEHQWLPWCREDHETNIAERKRIKEEHDAMWEFERKYGHPNGTSANGTADAKGAAGEKNATSGVKPRAIVDGGGEKKDKQQQYVLCFWLTGCVGDSKERAQRQYWVPYMLPFW